MIRILHWLLFLLGVIWASPYSLLGILVGLAGLMSGGRMQRRGIALEFYGGAVTWLVRHSPLGAGTLAITLGHTIIGQSAAALDSSREHEWVHVRQFQRWGPLMGPAYLLASLYIWFAGGRPYRDNPFEREAYGD